MKMVQVREALGAILCHDMTQIIPGEFKGPAFKKGHILQEEDIPKLLDMGKEQIFVWEAREGILHENDAAMRLARAAAGAGIRLSDPKEGKIDLVASEDGLLKVDVEGLYEVNNAEQIVLATLHTGQRVQ